MAVTASWYGRQIETQYDGTAVINFESDDIRTGLLTSGYTWNETAKDTHDNWDDLTPGTNQVTGTGYTAYGFVHSTQTVTLDQTSDEVRLALDNAQWTSASFTANKAVVYKKGGTDATSPLMGNVQFGGDETVSSGTFTIQWDSTGALKLDYT